MPSLLRHFLERVFLITLKLEKIVMILPESVPMANSDQRDALLLHVSVKMTLNIDAHCTGALVKNSILWLVIDQATHGHPLLFTTAQYVVPVVL